MAFDTFWTLGAAAVATLAAGWRVYWIPPWITVGVDEVKMVPVAMLITGWGLKIKLLCWAAAGEAKLGETVTTVLVLVVVAAGAEMGGLWEAETVVVATMGDGWVGSTSAGGALVVLVVLVPKISSVWESSGPKSLEDVASNMEAAALAAWSCKIGESS